MKKSGNKWSTKKCGRCGDIHTDYSGKLDSNNIEYVICGKTNKRMNILLNDIRDVVFLTKWENKK